MIEPVIQSDAFDERKITAPTKSSGSPSLPMGKRPRTILLKAGPSKTCFVISLLNTRGAIQLTFDIDLVRTPLASQAFRHKMDCGL